MHKTVLVIFVLGLACLAQDEQPISAPDDVLLTLRTQGDRQKFYLREPVATEYSYTAVPGRYLYVSPKGCHRKFPTDDRGTVFPDETFWKTKHKERKV